MEVSSLNPLQDAAVGTGQWTTHLMVGEVEVATRTKHQGMWCGPPRLPSQVCHSPGCATPGSACRLPWSGSLTRSAPPGAGPGWSGGQCTPTGSWPSWPPSGTAGRRGTRQSVPPGPPAAVSSREATLLGPGRGRPENQRTVSGGTAEDRARGLQKHGVFIFVQAGSRSSIRDSELGLKAAALESRCAV